MITVYEVLAHLRKVEYVGCLGIKTVTDAVNFYVAIKASGAPFRP